MKLISHRKLQYGDLTYALSCLLPTHTQLHCINTCLVAGEIVQGSSPWRRAMFNS